MNETRRDIRVPVRLRVQWKSIEEFAVDFAKDISKGGLFLETEQELLPGSPVLISVEIPDTNTVLELGARVIHRRSPEEAQQRNLPSGLGLQFVGISPEIIEQIETFIQERMGAQDASPSHKRSLNVLIVDDDPTFQLHAATAFRAGLDRVTFASNGFEAVSKVFQDLPDVILSDVHMPRMDGWQLLRLLRARPETRTIPILFLTRLHSEEERLRGYQLGVDDYLAKPFRPAELRARVERLTSRKFSPPSTASLRGDLAQVSLPSLLSFLAFERRTGELMVQGPPAGRLWLSSGRPLRAELDGVAQSPQNTAMLLLDIRWGSFEFLTGPSTTEDFIQMSMTQLLLEHARQQDEHSPGLTRSISPGFED